MLHNFCKFLWLNYEFLLNIKKTEIWLFLILKNIFHSNELINSGQGFPLLLGGHYRHDDEGHVGERGASVLDVSPPDHFLHLLVVLLVALVVLHALVVAGGEQHLVPEIRKKRLVGLPFVCYILFISFCMEYLLLYVIIYNYLIVYIC